MDHNQWDSILANDFDDTADDGGGEAGGHGVYGEGSTAMPDANTTLVPVVSTFSSFCFWM